MVNRRTTPSTVYLRHWILPWQMAHLLGSAGWNVVGVVLVSQGQQPLESTASISVAAVFILLGVGLAGTALQPLNLMLKLYSIKTLINEVIQLRYYYPCHN